MLKVLITDGLSQKGIKIFNDAGIETDIRKLSPDELIDEIKNYDGIVVRSGTTVTSSVIEVSDRLKVIGRAGSGLDNVDINSATKRGIVVMNTPGGNTVTTAEHTIAMLLSLTRMIPLATASTKSGKWEKGKLMGSELYNKTLGVIGIGQIGSYVAKLAQGLMMNVIAYDPYLSQEKAVKMGIESSDLDELYRRSDFITVHSPLTPETLNLIDTTAIEKMKDNVYIINCARGGIINETDLYNALKNGKVRGAALDVFEKEPVAPDNPLLSLNNVICTPHLGAATKEAQENVAIAIASQIVDYLINGIVRNAVNIPSVSPDVLPEIQPYINLGEKLGTFQTQIYEGGLEKVTIEYRGKVSTLFTPPITIAVLKGLLSPVLKETVNYVNAPIIARERGIEVEELKIDEAGDFSSLIVIRVKAKDKEGKITGALYSSKDPRIIEVDNFSIEIIPEGTMLMLSNNDRPGVIGSIGKILGDKNINISRMQFGRERPGGIAISVIGIDTDVTPEFLDKIKQLPNVLSVKQISL
ncbi:MAG: phosphoglycerate dehydrogenase [Nitrospirota bacterium]